jgi:hypothetical protein
MRSLLRHDCSPRAARADGSLLPHPLRCIALMVVTLAIAACERTSQTSGADSNVVGAPASSDSGQPVTTNVGWNPDAGTVLLVASDVPGIGEVIFPEVTDSTFGDSVLMDLAPVRGSRVSLFSRAGEAGSATVVGEDTTARADSSDDACEDWPLVRLRNDSRRPTAAWTVGLAAGRARSIALDSIGDLPRADSARLASDVMKLAASLPGDTARDFRGLPYYVRSVRRFQPSPGVQALVADVSRRINQEADPREEQILFVAERDSGNATGPWHVGFSERASGHEGTVETHDVLAALAVGAARRPTLLLARYVGDGVAYALVERNGAARWELRWVSAASGCSQ